jgi:hypothetical protein
MRLKIFNLNFNSTLLRTALYFFFLTLFEDFQNITSVTIYFRLKTQDLPLKPLFWLCLGLTQDFSSFEIKSTFLTFATFQQPSSATM